MTDNIHPDGRPLTIAEMFHRLAAMAERGELESLLPGIEHVQTEVKLAIDKKRPGWWLDQLLGTPSDAYTADGVRKFRNLESDHD